MTAAIDVLPSFALTAGGPLSAAFRARGIGTFEAAARHVWHLPYGRNSDRARPELVLEEGRGTCSTKHALLALLATEHRRPIELVVGIYLMNEANTPGVGPVLAAHGLEAVPEAHCYLRCEGRRIDLTHPPGATAAEPIESFLHEEVISPEQTGTYKQDLHRRFLATWAAPANLPADELWRIREACIAALGP